MGAPQTPTLADNLRSEISALRWSLRRIADMARPAMTGDPRRAKSVLARVNEEAEAVLRQVPT